MKRNLVFYLLFIVVLTGCASANTVEEKSAKQLAAEGMSEYRKGNYQTSIEAFDKLKDWYPFSKYAILAELKVADAHYKLQQYDEAIVAYEQFESLHPRNDALVYVIYQIGRCYFEQIDTVDRDQLVAHKALDVFQRLKRQFPNDSYSLIADEHIHRSYKSLAGHDLYVGKFYFRTKHYKAAKKRFESVISEYPDVGTHAEAFEYLTLCQAKMEDQD